MIRTIAAGAAVLLLAACGSSGSDDHDRVYSAVPVASISAEDLLKEYQENEVGADARYKGRVIEVSGTVDKVGKDIMDQPYVAFESAGIFGVQAFFDSKYAEFALSSVKKGQTLRVKCDCDGKFGNVLLKNCVRP